MDTTTLLTALAIAAVTGALSWWLTTRFLTQKHDLVAKDYDRQLAEGQQARSRDAAEAKTKAEQAEADHAALTKAVKNGKVRAETVSVQTSDKRVASGTAHKSRLRPGLARNS